MDLREFVKNALTEIDAAVSEASNGADRRIYFGRVEGKRTVEFDIAVTAEAKSSVNGKAGVRVLQIVEGGAEVSKENFDSKVSRISFGITIHPQTKVQEATEAREVEIRNDEIKRRIARQQ